MLTRLHQEVSKFTPFLKDIQMVYITPAQGELYCIFSGFLYGLLGFFGMNIIHEGLSIGCMSFWRFLISTFFCFFIILTQNKKDTFLLSHLNKQHLYAFLNGISFCTFSTFGYFEASLYIGTGLAMVIFFAYPAFVLFFDFILHKRVIEKAIIIPVFLITLGIFFLSDIQHVSFNLTGIALGLFGAISYAFYIILGKKGTLPPIISTAWISLGCSVGALLYTLFEQTFIIPTSFFIWANIGCIGILCTTLPILFLFKGLALITSERAAILSVLEPIFSLFFGMLLLHEKISSTQLIGIIIILSSAIITMIQPFLTTKRKDQKRL